MYARLLAATQASAAKAHAKTLKDGDFYLKEFVNTVHYYGNEDVNMEMYILEMTQSILLDAMLKFLANDFERGHSRLRRLIKTVDNYAPKYMRPIVGYFTSFMHAFGYYSSKSWSEAIKYINPIITQCPRQGKYFAGGLTDLLIMLSECYSCLMKFEDALLSARLAVSISHERFDLINRLQQPPQPQGYDNGRNGNWAPPHPNTEFHEIFRLPVWITVDVAPVLPSGLSVSGAYFNLASQLEKNSMGHLSVEWYERSLQLAIRFQVPENILSEMKEAAAISRVHLPQLAHKKSSGTIDNESQLTFEYDQQLIGSTSMLERSHSNGNMSNDIMQSYNQYDPTPPVYAHQVPSWQSRERLPSSSSNISVSDRSASSNGSRLHRPKSAYPRLNSPLRDVLNQHHQLQSDMMGQDSDKNSDRNDDDDINYLQFRNNRPKSAYSKLGEHSLQNDGNYDVSGNQYSNQVQISNGGNNMYYVDGGNYIDSGSYYSSNNNNGYNNYSDGNYYADNAYQYPSTNEYIVNPNDFNNVYHSSLVNTNPLQQQYFNNYNIYSSNDSLNSVTYLPVSYVKNEFFHINTSSLQKRSEAIVKIQSAARVYIAKKTLKNLRRQRMFKAKKSQRLQAAIVIQKYIRMYLSRAKYARRLKLFKKRVSPLKKTSNNSLKANSNSNSLESLHNQGNSSSQYRVDKNRVDNSESQKIKNGNDINKSTKRNNASLKQSEDNNNKPVVAGLSVKSNTAINKSDNAINSTSNTKKFINEVNNDQLGHIHSDSSLSMSLVADPMTFPRQSSEETTTSDSIVSRVHADLKKTLEIKFETLKREFQASLGIGKAKRLQVTDGNKVEDEGASKKYRGNRGKQQMERSRSTDFIEIQLPSESELDNSNVNNNNNSNSFSQTMNSNYYHNNNSSSNNQSNNTKKNVMWSNGNSNSDDYKRRNTYDVDVSSATAKNAAFARGPKVIGRYEYEYQQHANNRDSNAFPRSKDFIVDMTFDNTVDPMIDNFLNQCALRVKKIEEMSNKLQFPVFSRQERVFSRCIRENFPIDRAPWIPGRVMSRHKVRREIIPTSPPEKSGRPDKGFQRGSKSFKNNISGNNSGNSNNSSTNNDIEFYDDFVYDITYDHGISECDVPSYHIQYLDEYLLTKKQELLHPTVHENSTNYSKSVIASKVSESSDNYFNSRNNSFINSRVGRLGVNNSNNNQRSASGPDRELSAVESRHLFDNDMKISTTLTISSVRQKMDGIRLKAAKLRHERAIRIQKLIRGFVTRRKLRTQAFIRTEKLRRSLQAKEEELQKKEEQIEANYSSFIERALQEAKRIIFSSSSSLVDGAKQRSKNQSKNISVNKSNCNNTDENSVKKSKDIVKLNQSISDGNMQVDNIEVDYMEAENFKYGMRGNSIDSISISDMSARSRVFDDNRPVDSVENKQGDGISENMDLGVRKTETQLSTAMTAAGKNLDVIKNDTQNKSSPNKVIAPPEVDTSSISIAKSFQSHFVSEMKQKQSRLMEVESDRKVIIDEKLTALTNKLNENRDIIRKIRSENFNREQMMQRKFLDSQIRFETELNGRVPLSSDANIPQQSDMLEETLIASDINKVDTENRMKQLKLEALYDNPELLDAISSSELIELFKLVRFPITDRIVQESEQRRQAESSHDHTRLYLGNNVYLDLNKEPQANNNFKNDSHQPMVRNSRDAKEFGNLRRENGDEWIDYDMANVSANGNDEMSRQKPLEENEYVKKHYLNNNRMDKEKLHRIEESLRMYEEANERIVYDKRIPREYHNDWMNIKIVKESQKVVKNRDRSLEDYQNLQNSEKLHIFETSENSPRFSEQDKGKMRKELDRYLSEIVASKKSQAANVQSVTSNGSSTADIRTVPYDASRDGKKSTIPTYIPESSVVNRDPEYGATNPMGRGLPVLPPQQQQQQSLPPALSSSTVAMKTQAEMQPLERVMDPWDPRGFHLYSVPLESRQGRLERLQRSLHDLPKLFRFSMSISSALPFEAVMTCGGSSFVRRESSKLLRNEFREIFVFALSNDAMLFEAIKTYVRQHRVQESDCSVTMSSFSDNVVFVNSLQAIFQDPTQLSRFLGDVSLQLTFVTNWKNGMHEINLDAPVETQGAGGLIAKASFTVDIRGCDLLALLSPQQWTVLPISTSSTSIPQLNVDNSIAGNNPGLSISCDLRGSLISVASVVANLLRICDATISESVQRFLTRLSLKRACFQLVETLVRTVMSHGSIPMDNQGRPHLGTIHNNDDDIFQSAYAANSNYDTIGGFQDQGGLYDASRLKSISAILSEDGLVDREALLGLVVQILREGRGHHVASESEIAKLKRELRQVLISYEFDDRKQMAEGILWQSDSDVVVTRGDSDAKAQRASFVEDEIVRDLTNIAQGILRDIDNKYSDFCISISPLLSTGTSNGIESLFYRGSDFWNRHCDRYLSIMESVIRYLRLEGDPDCLVLRNHFERCVRFSLETEVESLNKFNFADEFTVEKSFEKRILRHAGKEGPNKMDNLVSLFDDFTNLHQSTLTIGYSKQEKAVMYQMSDTVVKLVESVSIESIVRESDGDIRTKGIYSNLSKYAESMKIGTDIKENNVNSEIMNEQSNNSFALAMSQANQIDPSTNGLTTVSQPSESNAVPGPVILGTQTLNNANVSSFNILGGNSMNAMMDSINSSIQNLKSNQNAINALFPEFNVAANATSKNNNIDARDKTMSTDDFASQSLANKTLSAGMMRNMSDSTMIETMMAAYFQFEMEKQILFVMIEEIIASNIYVIQKKINKVSFEISGVEKEPYEITLNESFFANRKKMVSEITKVLKISRDIFYQLVIQNEAFAVFQKLNLERNNFFHYMFSQLSIMLTSFLLKSVEKSTINMLKPFSNEEISRTIVQMLSVSEFNAVVVQSKQSIQNILLELRESIDNLTQFQWQNHCKKRKMWRKHSTYDMIYTEVIPELMELCVADYDREMRMNNKFNNNNNKFRKTDIDLSEESDVITKLSLLLISKGINTG